MMAAQMDIQDILQEIEQSGPYLGNHRAKINTLMRHFHKAGLTIATSADERHLARAVSTVKGYARDLALAFPDYVPLFMRPPKPPKEKKRRKTEVKKQEAA